MSTSTVRRRRVVRGDEADRDEPAGLEHQQVAGRVGLDRRDRPSVGAARRPAPWHRPARAPTARRALVERLRLELHAAQALGRRCGRPRPRTARCSGRAPNGFDAHDRAACPGRRPAPIPGSSALRLVGPELDDHLAAQAVGLGDPADFEQLSRRRCPRWPGRRPWRPPR